MHSRKRPPLVSRSSNAVEEDVREIAKRLAVCSGLEAESLISKIAEMRILASDVEYIVKLILSKLARMSPISDRILKDIQRLLERMDIVPVNTCIMGILRIMCKNSSGKDVIEWSDSCKDSASLLFLEMISWDSLSDGQPNKQKIGGKLAACGGETGFALNLDKETFMEFDYPNLSLPQRRVVAAGGLNIGVWSAMLEGSPDRARRILKDISETYLSSRTLSEQVSLVRLFIGADDPSDDATDSRPLLHAIKQISRGAPLTVSLESRYEVALLSLQVSKRSSNKVKRVVAASYALHCLKWTEKPQREKTGREGLLSLLICDERNVEKLFASLIHPVPCLMQRYVILEAVRIAADSYEAIGFLPGASWLYQKGLDFLNTSDFCVFRKLFQRRLREMHVSSETAIRDESVDYSSFDSIESTICESSFSLIDSDRRLEFLRNVVVEQYALQHSKFGHIERLERLRNAPESKSRPYKKYSGVSMTFTVENDRLFLSVKNGDVILKELALADHVTETAVALSEDLNDFLLRNKTSIASRHRDVEGDSKAFWEDRKLFDLELSDLMAVMERDLFGSEAVAILNSFIQDFIDEMLVLFLPDILLGFPIESFSVFREYNCVRGVCFSETKSKKRKTPDIAAKSFVLNPNGDCGSTENKVKSVLERNGWKGHSGAPTLSDSAFTRMLTESDVFLFSGHGGGEKHWSGTSVQRLFLSEKSVRAAILMGCSSARPYGDMRNSFCTPFHYLIGGAWLVVGTLWDVLGRELDRITIELVERFTTVEKLAFVMNSAKRAAKLKHLSSASVVVYIDVSQFR